MKKYSATIFYKTAKGFEGAITKEVMAKDESDACDQVEAILKKRKGKRSIMNGHAVELDSTLWVVFDTNGKPDSLQVSEIKAVEYIGRRPQIDLNRMSYREMPEAEAKSLFATKEANLNEKHFPNGFKYWMESHHEIVAAITHGLRNEKEYPELAAYYLEVGSAGMYQLGEQLTDKFEEENTGIEWGIDKEFIDTIEQFIEVQFKHL